MLRRGPARRFIQRSGKLFAAALALMLVVPASGLAGPVILFDDVVENVCDHRPFMRLAHEQLLRRLGIAAAREGIPWPMVDTGGRYDFTAIDRYVHISVSTRFQSRFRLKHLEWEEVDDPGEELGGRAAAQTLLDHGHRGRRRAQLLDSQPDEEAGGAGQQRDFVVRAPATRKYNFATFGERVRTLILHAEDLSRTGNV